VKNTHVFRDGMVIIIVAGLWLSWTIGATPAIGQTLFTQLSLPNGIATDAAGNVYIHNDSGLQNQITKFTPNGVRVGNLPIGGFFDTAFTGRLVFERNSGLLMDLLEPGLLPFINPNTLQVVGGLDLRGVTPDARSVFDAAVGGVRNFSGNILPGRITYGDLAVLRRGNQYDFYMTGVSIITAFVMRLRLLPDGTTVGPQVLLASTLTTAGAVNEPRGVAVNANGTVITTLPVIPGPTGAIDGLVAFNADFVPGTGPAPSINRQFDFTSRGMTTDTVGNFYVATGAVSTSVCGAGGSGALVFLPANLSTLRCLNLNSILADSQDVAISPANDRAYMTINSGQVVLFRIQ
jgi:hypothetical protein